MTSEQRTFIKESYNLVYLIRQRYDMNLAAIGVYDILDFMQIEKEIKESKELLKFKIDRL
ncbi:hypothetical protein CCP3SC1AL1_1620002 [Gammaproteobacteria bacterium]